MGVGVGVGGWERRLGHSENMFLVVLIWPPLDLHASLQVDAFVVKDLLHNHEETPKVPKVRCRAKLVGRECMR